MMLVAIMSAFIAYHTISIVPKYRLTVKVWFVMCIFLRKRGRKITVSIFIHNTYGIKKSK